MAKKLKTNEDLVRDLMNYSPFETYPAGERHFDRICCLDLFACIMEDIDAIPLP